jgi:hypothetical protein
VRQAARVVAMDRERLRSGDRAHVRFRFLQRPEYLTPGALDPEAQNFMLLCLKCHRPTQLFDCETAKLQAHGLSSEKGAPRASAWLPMRMMNDRKCNCRMPTLQPMLSLADCFVSWIL